MAGEYYRWLARDEKPSPPPPPMTKKEKFKNWIHYHKLWFFIVGVLVWIAGSMLWNLFGIGKIHPDYVIAYVGKIGLTEEEALALKSRVEEFGLDENGNGKVEVEFRQYLLERDGDFETAMYYNYAAETELLADVTVGESELFFMEDPDGIQKAYQILANKDGSPCGEYDYKGMNKVFSLESCQAFGELCSMDELFPKLYIGRRPYYDEAQAAAHVKAETLWDALTEGAE